MAPQLAQALQLAGAERCPVPTMRLDNVGGVTCHLHSGCSSAAAGAADVLNLNPAKSEDSDKFLE